MARTSRCTPVGRWKHFSKAVPCSRPPWTNRGWCCHLRPQEKSPGKLSLWTPNGQPGFKSEEWSFVARPAATTLTAPVDHEVLESGELPLAIDFSWVSESAPTQWLVQVSKTKDFDTLVLEGSSNATQWRGKELEAGTYWWRVLAQHGAAGSYPSEAKMFTIAHATSALRAHLAPSKR